jgi:uncharacterized membrane protein YoaK (UPF0700 family)
MFRHKGKTRTLKHNLQIASLLSFVAGMVNVAGFFAIQRLTTNVTGHFAYFVDEVFKLHWWQAFVYFLFVFFFFLGSFVSNLLIEMMSRKHEHYIYILPASIECLILLIVGCWGNYLITISANTVACGLLFAMGLQNSLVTTISSSSVRTTHLTGLFTDLGIEMSQLFFYKEKVHRSTLLPTIKLRFSIISFFFAGGIMGGVLFTNFGVGTLIVAAVVLAGGLVYDSIKFRLILLSRKLKKSV